MKIRVTFESDDIQGNEIGEIHDKELSENFLKLIIRFLGDKSTIYGKEIGAWGVKEDQLRLCVEREDKGITCYTCEVEAELTVQLNVVGQQTLDGDHWSTKLLRGIMAGHRKD